ncbi:MAG: ABC transporter permease [Deltaproteobacteria bacterium]|nr:ABC transporter permease [Deltaproteobacteria bacterium]
MTIGDIETYCLQLFNSTLRISIPLLFAALGGFLSERSGVINIALEGLMLVGAFASAAITYFTHSPWLGALGGALIASFFALFYGVFVIYFRANQIVAGVALNMLAFGLVPLMAKVLFNVTGSSPGLSIEDRFQIMPVVLIILLIVFIHFWFQKSSFGLWAKFAGEHPMALHSAGVSVFRVRLFSVWLSGILAGLGGMSLSIFLSSAYSRNMTAGRGFMALAALVFGKWKPLPTVFACLLFGFVDALQIQLQGIVLWGTEPVPVQLIQILPYVITILVLSGFVGNARPPSALGLPFTKS